MFARIRIANRGQISCRVIRTARRMGIATVALLAVGMADTALACSVLTPAGQRRQGRYQQRYLDRRADRVVVGTFRADPGGREANDDYSLAGVIEVERRGRIDRYRVRVGGEINCGFPNHYVEDGSYGRFFLERADYPEHDDRADGLIDNYRYVHFESLERGD